MPDSHSQCVQGSQLLRVAGPPCTPLRPWAAHPLPWLLCRGPEHSSHSTVSFRLQFNKRQGVLWKWSQEENQKQSTPAAQEDFISSQAEDGEGCGENKLCKKGKARVSGDRSTGCCKGKGMARRRHPHISGESPGWPSPPPRQGRINLCSVHRTQEQLTLPTRPSAAPGSTLKQSTAAETHRRDPRTAGRDVVGGRARAVQLYQARGPQNSPEHPVQLVGNVVKGLELTGCLRAGSPSVQRWQWRWSLPCAHSPSRDREVSLQWGRSTAKGCMS